MMFCSNCGQSMPDNANVCGNCGTRLKIPAQSIQSQPSTAHPPLPPASFTPLQPAPVMQKKGLTPWSWIGGLLLVGLLCGSAFLVLRPLLIGFSSPAATPAPFVVTVVQTPTRQVVPPTATQGKLPTPMSSPDPKDSIVLAESISALFSNPKVDFYDDFNNLSPDVWYIDGAKLNNQGQVVMQGNGNWDHCHLYRNEKIENNGGYIITFKSGSNPDVSIHVETGGWAEPEFKRYGIYIQDNGFATNNWQVDVLWGESLSGNLRFTRDRWYTLLLAIDDNARVLLKIWDRDNASQSVEYRKVVNPNWTDLKWTFGINCNLGETTVDSVLAISFDGFK